MSPTYRPNLYDLIMAQAMQSEQAVTPTPVSVHTQKQSPFFRLPLELRSIIYSHIFTHTRITHGKRDAWGKYEALQIVPVERTLSLLRTCRRISADIGNRWLGQVLFNFEDVKTMLDKLAPLPIEAISAIRHLRVRGGSLTLHLSDDHVYFQLVHALKLLGGLQLDVLTVLAISSKGGFSYLGYDILDGLIRFGQGWKELRFISQDSEMLGYAHDRRFDDRHARRAQPESWAAVMDERDGISSQSSVTIYRSTLAEATGSVLNKKTRILLQQQSPEADQEATYGQEADDSLMTGIDRRFELMIVIKRGKGVNYQEKLESPFLPKELRDIRQECPDMTWAEIRKKHGEPLENLWSEMAMNSGDSQDGDSSGEFEKMAAFNGPTQKDDYEDVDDYVWDSPSMTF